MKEKILTYFIKKKTDLYESKIIKKKFMQNEKEKQFLCVTFHKSKFV